MSGKSPRKNGQKTAATKTLKEKRVEKKAKADGKAHQDPIGDIKR